MMLLTVGLGVGFILVFELLAMRRQGGDLWGVLLGLASGVFYAGVVDFGAGAAQSRFRVVDCAESSA